MKVLGLVTVLSLAMGSFAQNNETVIKVAVGGVMSQNQNIYMFTPNNFTASNGSIVQFEFSGNIGNHSIVPSLFPSITQSSFDNPCQEIDGGFDSGWVFVPNGFGGPYATWNLTITSTDPIWFYCKQTLPQYHCASGMQSSSDWASTPILELTRGPLIGMVGAINPPTSGNTFDNYVNNAKQATNQLPGQAAGGLIGQGASASAAPGPITSPLQFAGTPTSGQASATGGDSSGGGSAPSGGSGSNGASAVGASSVLTLFAATLGMLIA
ncbi:hypothetical protein PQX77_014907 [Marasmius sp. AFHP31]|nr:hypothetical protein PQX77_014907 [Marasmius sp. AFHP31]